METCHAVRNDPVLCRYLFRLIQQLNVPFDGFLQRLLMGLGIILGFLQNPP